MADNDVLSGDWADLIEDLRRRVFQLENGTAEVVAEQGAQGRYVRLTELGATPDLGGPVPFPFGELVPYKATAVIWNRVDSDEYGWVDQSPVFDPDEAAAPGVVREYVFAANGTTGLEGTVQFIERKVATIGVDMDGNPDGILKPYWFFSVNGETQLAKITLHVLDGSYTAKELDADLVETGNQYGAAGPDPEEGPYPEIMEVSGATDVAADTIVQVFKKKGNYYFKKAGGGGARPFVVITSVTDAANYVGNIVTSPTDPTVITIGVTIQVDGATANEFNVGYDNFADLSDGVYWLDGRLLG